MEENYDGVWETLKKEYLKLKNNNKQNKHSFILYHEAINNLYDQIQQEKNKSYDKKTKNIRSMEWYS